MGKTIRRKDIVNKGHYYASRRQAPKHVSDETVADNIFHSDKPKRWSGLGSSVKEDQNMVARSDKRRIKALKEFDDLDTVNTDQKYARMANACWQHS
ncbi:hypothetical protein MYO4S_00022 [Serratia phage 4S]|nr:hypothetical protein MYO4S_00022 [Serratia phage 4S]